jgi:hypothetical protein
MGNSNFFSKVASIDPLAQALDLPGAHKYAQAQAQDVQSNVGPYAGQAPTLAAANVGYAPGTTAQGATPGWNPINATASGNKLFSGLQSVANNPVVQGAFATNPIIPSVAAKVGAPGTGTPQANPYVTAARGAASQNQYGS